MTNSWRYSLAATVAAVLCLPALAQQGVRPQPERAGVRVDVDREGVDATARKDQKESPVRVSEVLGMDVKNHQDEDLGDIEDLVIDPKSGKVRYAAISMGGFLGLGDELFAVPWSAIKCQKDEDGDYVALLNIDKARMENAKGFNQENWPDFGDERWQRENDKRYDVEVDVDTTDLNGNNRVVPRVNIERDR